MATVVKGKVLRQDLEHWDGITKTAARKDATGGTITGLVNGTEVDVLTVYGSAESYTWQTIKDCIRRIGSASVTLVFNPGTWVIDQDLTIGSNFTCRIPAGCVFAVSSGKTLTFSGPVIRDAQTWTSGSGTVTENGTRYFSGKVDLTGAVIQGTNALVFEGSSDDGFETTLVVTNPTADRTITIPDADVNLATVPNLSGNNAFTANNSFSGITTFSGNVIDNIPIVSNDAGASAGPTVTLDRNSATPAAADVLGSIPFKGRDSGGGTDTYVNLQAEIVDQTATSEDGRLAIQSVIAGTLATRAYVGNGIYTVGGSDQGANTVQGFSGVYDGIYRVGAVKLASGTASASATVDIVLTSYTAYKHKLIKAYIRPATDATALRIRTSTDGGSSFATGATNYGYCRHTTSSEGVETTAATATENDFIAVTNTDIGNATAEGIYIDIWLHDFEDTTQWPRIRWSGSYLDDGATPKLMFTQGTGVRRAGADVDAIRFYFSSGNANMEWELYGHN